MKYRAYYEGYGSVDDDAPALTADTVFEQDNEPTFTGLYDADGRPLYRVPEKVRMGFTR